MLVTQKSGKKRSLYSWLVGIEIFNSVDTRDVAAKTPQYSYVLHLQSNEHI